jgi:hypothetical protein
MGYTEYIFAQSEDYRFRGYNISFHAENSTITSSAAAEQASEQPSGIPGSHMVITVLAEHNNILLWYQAEGDDITLASGDLSQGLSTTWNSTKVPIPDA